MNILSVRNIRLKFGGLTALQDVSFDVKQGEIFSVIGPNGAGKTSLFNVITGIYSANEGEILLEQTPLTEKLTGRILIRFMIFSLIAAFLTQLLCVLNLTWQSAINDLYVFKQPFNWSHSISTAATSFFSIGFLPAIIGGAIGFIGSYVVWHRARKGTEVVSLLGITRTFQNIRLFKGLTVKEHVLLGLDKTLKAGFFASILKLPSMQAEEKKASELADKALAVVDLTDKAETLATTLSYGYQRRVEIARAIAAEPKILLLDEPAAGMNPTETTALMDLIEKIRDSGITVILIEHHMKVVMGISDRVVVLDYGNKIAEGSPDEIRNDPLVIEAYLGKAVNEH